MTKWLAQDLRDGEWVDTTGNVYDDEVPRESETIDFLRSVAVLFNSDLPYDHFRVVEFVEAK